MPLNLYPDIQASGSVPHDWKPVRGGTLKYPVRNPAVLRELRRLLSGRGKKSSSKGTPAKFMTLNMLPGG